MNNASDREVAVFNAALQLAVEQRAAYLDQDCAGDDALRLRVEALLKVHDEVGAFLENPTQESGPAAARLSPDGTIRAGVSTLEKTGDRIGRYKLLQQIGEGGCGVVYLAEQQEPVRRKVAVKVIKLGMDTKHVIARFEAERQALALMDHPNIAKVLDAGATETGRPFFVMELVRGFKITEYCDQNNLATRQRLKLFTQVCQAIQHAHQKGIIHRDIKPSNILVADHDGVAVPKVIDFGIAKATTDQRLTDKTLFTALEQFMGTPAYMSPEQARLSGLDIDTRTDIYSLGVLLYELLTGKTPFDAKELLAAGLEEMRRTIREQEPNRPSTALSTMVAADLTTVARHRQSEAPQLVHLVCGDLDWIVMKALEKDRTRRYETANGLAMDVQRHLENEPVTAGPPSNAYRFQKFVRRNKLAVASTSLVAAVLTLGVVVSTWQAIRATQAEREQTRLREEAEESRNTEAKLRTLAETDEKKAKTEAAKSEQVAQFLKDMLQGVGPGFALGQDTKLLRGILDKTADRVKNELSSQPEVQGELLNVCGVVYSNIGERTNAEVAYREALVVQRKVLGNFHPDLAETLFGLAQVLDDEDRPAESEAAYRESLEIRRKSYGNEHWTVAACLNNITGPLIAQGKLADAEFFSREALAMKRKLLANDDPEVAISLRACFENGTFLR
ncbi:MAG TPA: serine/threonine-protein kinase [Verrucomicrobiae bacterium]|jgi:serine/threonine protein kinase